MRRSNQPMKLCCWAASSKICSFVSTSAVIATSILPSIVDAATVVRYHQSRSFFQCNYRRHDMVMYPRCPLLLLSPSSNGMRSLHTTPPSYFAMGSNSNNDVNDSAATKHRLYLQQIQELESERQSLFVGTTNDDGKRNNVSSSTIRPVPDFVSYASNDDSDQNNTVDGDVVMASNIIQHDTIDTENDPKNATNAAINDIDGTHDNNNNNNNNTLQLEREELYGFTTEERNAWGTIGTTSKNKNSTTTNHANLLRDIKAARQQQQQQQEDKEAEERKNQVTASSLSFSHLTRDEKNIHMVDVGSKVATRRTATAQSLVIFPPEVLLALNRTEHSTTTTTDEWIGPKGPIFATAITAGIMGVKQTSALIPLCHPLPIENIHIDIHWYDSNTLQIQCTCSVTHKTGVEMEALMGCSIAALTIYDMVKAISHNVQITNTQLIYKDGGKRRVDKR